MKTYNAEPPDLTLPYWDWLKRLGLPTLVYGRETADLLEVYKMLNTIGFANKDKLFTMATYRQTRGCPLNLFKRRSRVNMSANSFSIRVIGTWSSLPSNIVLAPYLDSFKSRLNKHWHGNPFMIETSRYIPEVHQTLATQRRIAPSQVIEWPPLDVGGLPRCWVPVRF